MARKLFTPFGRQATKQTHQNNGALALVPLHSRLGALHRAFRRCVNEAKWPRHLHSIPCTAAKLVNFQFQVDCFQLQDAARTYPIQIANGAATLSTRTLC